MAYTAVLRNGAVLTTFPGTDMDARRDAMRSRAQWQIVFPFDDIEIAEIRRRAVASSLAPDFKFNGGTYHTEGNGWE